MSYYLLRQTGFTRRELERSRKSLAVLEGTSLPEARALVTRLRAYARTNAQFAPVMARFGLPVQPAKEGEAHKDGAVHEGDKAHDAEHGGEYADVGHYEHDLPGKGQPVELRASRRCNARDGRRDVGRRRDEQRYVGHLSELAPRRSHRTRRARRSAMLARP